MLVIYGPTTTGKTGLAIALAKKFGGEIISADSRQVYKNLDIGTGKVSFESDVKKHEGYWEVDGIKIHGYDLAKAGETFTVVDFIKFAHEKTDDLKKQGKLPIIAGGTGFYINALTKGIDTIGIKPNYKLREELDELSVFNLYHKLSNLNQKKAKSLNQSDKNNPRRLIRAIEVETAKSKVKPIGNKNENTLFIGLTAPNDFLYKKADLWLQTRLGHGIVEEVSNLVRAGVDQKWLDNLGLEYRWLSRYQSGQVDLDTALERLRGDIHSFIRRQKTWFRKFGDIKIFDITQQNWQDQLEKTIKPLISK